MLYPGGIHSVAVNSVVRKDPSVICTVVKGLQLKALLMLSLEQLVLAVHRTNLFY